MTLNTTHPAAATQAPLAPLASLAPLSAEALQTVQSLREQVAVQARLRLQHAQGTPPDPGPRTPQAPISSEAELRQHLEFLIPSLATGNSRPFANYLRWLRSVRQARRLACEPLNDGLLCMAECLAPHLGPEKNTLDQLLQDSIRASEEAAPARRCEAEDRDFAIQPRFEEALLQGDRAAALALMAELETEGLALLEIEVHLIARSLQQIGLRWQRNEISVAQEHLATATASTVMADRFAHHPLPPLNGQRALLACVQGNRHSVGLSMVSDALELAGWEVQCLGADTPTPDLVAQVLAWRPGLVALSLAFSSHLLEAREAIAQIRSACGRAAPRIVVGGEALNQEPAWVDFLGADGYARDALGVLREAQARPPEASPAANPQAC